MFPCLAPPRAWKWLVALWAVAGLCPSAQAQLPLPTTPAPLAPPAPGGSAVPSQSAPPTVEQLAERLRAVEATNRDLIRLLEGTRREHDEQLPQTREWYEEVTRRS